MSQCKGKIYSDWGRSHQCLNREWKDGFCKIHHPESVKKREEERARRYEEKKKHSPWYLFGESQKENKILLELIERFVDSDPCHYDHHGLCQTHNLHTRPCPHEVAKKILEEKKSVPA